jgi:hypothetical protein
MIRAGCLVRQRRMQLNCLRAGAFDFGMFSLALAPSPEIGYRNGPDPHMPLRSLYRVKVLRTPSPRRFNAGHTLPWNENTKKLRRHSENAFPRALPSPLFAAGDERLHQIPELLRCEVVSF